MGDGASDEHLHAGLHLPAGGLLEFALQDAQSAAPDVGTHLGHGGAGLVLLDELDITVAPLDLEIGELRLDPVQGQTLVELMYIF